MSYATPVGGPYPAAHPEHVVIEEAKRKFLEGCYEMAPRVGAVVEVGTMRYDGVAADGRSTLVFARLCQRDRRRFVSIDSSREALTTASIALVRENLNDVELRFGVGEDVLAEMDGEIGLLYLDGGDDPAAALAQVQAAETHLMPGAVIVLDDCHPYEAMNIPRNWGQPMPEGKGTLALPYMRGTVHPVPPGSFHYDSVAVVKVTQAWAMARAICSVKHP
jgi:hypothetical protein